MIKRYLGYAVWLLFAPFMITLVLSSYILAPIIALPIFVRKEGNKEYLVKYLYWFQTFDNPVNEGYLGNYGLHEWVNRFRPTYETSGFSRYMFRIYWMWRNSVYGFARNLFGVACTDVTYIYKRTEKDFLAIRTNDNRWFTPFQLRGRVFGAYVYIGWKLTMKVNDGSPMKMYTIQINPFK